MSEINSLDRRRRGRGFPVLDLDSATKVLREAGKYGVDHAPSAFAGYLGHESNKSGPFLQKLAALRDWGLISSRGERIVFTDLGKRLAFPESVEQSIVDLQEAFAHCPIFYEAYTSFAKGRDLDLETVGNSAIRNLGIAAASKEAFIRSFSVSATTAGLAEQPREGILRLAAPQSATGTSDRPTSTFPEPSRDASTAAAARSTRPIVLQQSWKLSDGQLDFVVRSDRPIPSKAFHQLGVVMTGIESLAALLGASPESETEVTKG